MRIETTTDQGTVVIACHGRLNMVAAPLLRQAVSDSVEAGKPRVVVDLTDTDFVDSSGLGALVNGLKTTRQAGGDLRIASPPEQARTVLSLTNLDRVLKPYDTVQDARHEW